MDGLRSVDLKDATSLPMWTWSMSRVGRCLWTFSKRRSEVIDRLWFICKAILTIKIILSYKFHCLLQLLCHPRLPQGCVQLTFVVETLAIACGRACPGMIKLVRWFFEERSRVGGLVKWSAVEGSWGIELWCLREIRYWLFGEKNREGGLEAFLFQNIVPWGVFCSFEGPQKLIVLPCVFLLHLYGGLDHLVVVRIDSFQQLDPLCLCGFAWRLWQSRHRWRFGVLVVLSRALSDIVQLFSLVVMDVFIVLMHAAAFLLEVRGPSRVAKHRIASCWRPRLLYVEDVTEVVRWKPFLDVFEPKPSVL